MEKGVSWGGGAADREATGRILSIPKELLILLLSAWAPGGRGHPDARVCVCVFAKTPLPDGEVG